MSRSSSNRGSRKSVRRPIPQGTDSSFTDFTPEMEAAFAHLDEQMLREGFSAGPSHPFPHSSSSGRGKKNKGRKGVNSKSASQTLAAYRTADPSLMSSAGPKSKKRSRAQTHVVDSGEFARTNSRGPPRTLEPLSKSTGGRLGTPLYLANMTDSALLAVESGEFEASASAAHGGNSQHVLLPYLDRLDYIDVELSRRNLGEERMGAGVAHVVTVNPSDSTVSISRGESAPSTARSHPETNSLPSYPTTPINIIETEGGDDMFFRAPTPSPRSSTRPAKKSRTLGALQSNFLSKHTHISPIKHPGFSGPSAAEHVNLTMSLSHHKTHAVEDHPDTPTPKSICGRYYRTTLLAGLHTGARERTKLTPSCPSFAYRRSLVWLLRLIEEVYDAAYRVEEASAKKSGGVHVSAKERERKKALKTAFLTVEGENISKNVIVPGDDGEGADELVFGVSMPSLLLQFLGRSFGTKAMVNQTLLDLMVCVELHRTSPEVELFSLFLRELYDEDCFVFFLHSRNLVVKRLGLCLADLKQRVYPDEVSKLNLKEGAVMVRKYSKISTINNAYMNKEHIIWLLRHIIPATNSDGDDLNGESVHAIRRHVLWMVEIRSKLMLKFQGPTHVLADGSFTISTYTLADIFLVLKLLVDEFAQTGEAIVKELKFNDDGYRMTMLEMLQETVKDDDKLKLAKAKVDEAMHRLTVHELNTKKATSNVGQLTRQLNDAQIRKDNEEEMKLEIDLGQAKTSLFLMKNQAFKLKGDLTICEKELKAIEFHHNKVWEDIIINEQQGKSKMAKFNNIKKKYPDLSKNTNTGLLRFGMHLVQKYNQHQVTVEAAKKFSGDWKMSLEEIREERVKVLQRAYRKRRTDRIAQMKAQSEINARRAIQKAAAEEELRKQEAENRRKLAQAERQMARVRQILRKRRIDEARIKQRQSIVKQQAAFSEAERRNWHHNRKWMKRIWKEWNLQVKFTNDNIKRHRLILMSLIQKWKMVTEMSSKKRKAALLLQRIYRGKLEYRRVKEMKEKLSSNNSKAKAFFTQLKYRGMAAAYDGWKLYWDRSKRIKKLRDGAMARGIVYRFDLWKKYVVITLDLKEVCATIINQFGRTVLKKTWVARIRRERVAAELIQRLWRGRDGKKRFGAMKERAWDNEIKVTTYRARKIRELKRGVFYRILAENKVRKGLLRLNRSLLLITFKYGLKKNAHFAKINRDKEYKRRNDLAKKIQSAWRGYLGRQAFLHTIKLHTATIFLQSCVRRNLARTRIYIIRINNHNAIELQCAWRVFVAKNVLHSLKVADFLGAADRNDYDRMLENWCGEETDEDGNNALHRASMYGSKRCVKLCVAEGIDPNIYNSKGKTGLHLAIESVAVGRDATVEWLLDHEAEIEAPDYDGNTPLLLASRLGCAACTRALLERDAEVDALDYEGLTPLMLAISFDCDGTHEATVAQLLMFASDPNQVGEDGCVPLHTAVSNGDGAIQVIRHLLAFEADLTKQDDQGYTPFMYAVNLNLVKTAQLMMEFNADVEFKDNDGRNALHIAASAGHAEVIPVICEGDCDLEGKDADGDTALHIAVSLNHVNVCKTLLAVGCNASVQNDVGDQPAHVCARLGRLECMQSMLEYDAHMGRRNWAELTPIGVARMHSQMEIVDLLKSNFSPEQLGEVGDDDDVDVNAWDNAIMDKVEEWEEAWDEENQVSYWVSKETGEIRDAAHPPEMEVGKIMDARAKGERHMTRRVQVRKGEGELGTAQYNVHHKSEWEEIRQMRREWQSAILIEKCWRMKSAILQKLQLRLERKSANIIQRAGSSWRWRFHDYNFRLKQRAARKIQSFQRMRFLSHFYKFYQRERLWWYRAERVCAEFGQRLWRGYVGRRAGRRVLEVKNQPHPDDKLNFDYWMARQREAFPPRRSFKLYDEYILYGHPASWLDRQYTSEAGFFRDVRVYVNKVTDQAQWWIPDEWDEQDRYDYQLREQVRLTGFTMEEFNAATKMQSLWKSRQARLNFKMVLAATRMGKQAEEAYLQDPDDVVALSNYVLYLHAIEHEYVRARKLYRFLFEFMEERGPDNPFVLYSVAIFGAVTCEEDWTYIKDWAYRGNKADLASGKKAGKAATSYNLANAGFFKAKALLDQSGESWHNYALCRMLVYQDLEGARDAFIRAVVAAPHDKRISKNFNVLIQDQDYYHREPPWDCFDEFQAHQRAIVQAREEEEAAERKAQEEAEELQNAAQKVQRWYRHCKSKGMVKVGMAALLKTQLLKETSEGNYDDNATLYTEVTWEECVDEDGKVFWYNTITGESSWEPPNVDGSGSVVSSLEGGTVATGDDDERSIITMGNQEWEICFDEETGKRFFFNTATEESQWDTPREEYDNEMDPSSAMQIVTREEEPEEELPLWEVVVDEETGQKFYFNTVMETSVWDTPRECKEDLVAKGEKEEWEECEDEEGNVYWYNDLTGEAQWHKPGTEPLPPEIWRPEILPLCRGKLTLTLVSGTDIRGRDKTLKAYMKVRLGEKTKENKKKKPHKTKTAEKA